MTSYNNEPGPSNNLNDYLVSLAGFSKSDGLKSTEPTVLTKENAIYVGNLMTKWLPTLLDTYGLDGIFTQDYSEHGYRDEGFVSEQVTQEWGDIPNIVDMLATGSFVEIAGPSATLDYEKFLVGLRPKIMVNIDPNIKDVTVVGDATHAPFKDASVGTLFISALPGAPREYLKLFSTLRPEAIAEAARIVQTDGYLLWLGGTSADVQDIINSGFAPEYLYVKSSINKMTGYMNELYREPFLTIDGVYRRITE